jgi:hypothetical protein
MDLRQLSLREDFKGVSHPESHAQGLIRLCRENRKLRITRYVSLLDCMLPLFSSAAQDDRRDDHYDRTSITGYECLAAMVTWIQEASLLSTHGMPHSSFSLVIDNTTRESDWAWQIVARAASLQETYAKFIHTSNLSLGPRDRSSAYPMPSDLPSTFATNVLQILEGNSTIRLTAEPRADDVWDTDVLFHQRQHWDNEDWYEEWHSTILDYTLDTDIWKRLHPRYSITPAGFKKIVTSVVRRRI